MDSGQVNRRIERVLGVLERRAAWIALCLLVPAGLVFFISKRQPMKYTATASLVFAEPQLGRQGARRLSRASSQNRQERRSTNVKLLQLGDLATATAGQVHLTTDQVRRAVHVRAQGDSNVVDVSGTAATPGLAAQIANAYASQFVTEQQAANRRYASALRVEAKRLGALFSKEGARSARLALQGLVQSLGTLADLRNGTVRVAQPAAIPRSKSSAGVFRDSAIAAGLGLLLGLAIALLLERLDSRIREPKELGDAYRAPVLGEVPQSAAFESASELISRASRELLPQREAEAFRRIRANLRYQKSEREPRTLLVTSAETGDGKTTVARHLAVVAAHMGSTVLLVEADLRHPCLAAQLDIAAGPGVADVLIGSVSLWRATQPVAIDRATGVAARPLALDVLVAGAWPPANPAELLESGAMGALLGQAHDSYDLVVLDTPPLSVVSDAFPLLGRVDGVVVVGRMGRNQRPAAEHLRETLERVGAPLLGVVANGVRARGGREPYYAEVDADLASAEGASAETGYERRVATGRPSPAGLSAATVDGAHRRLSQTATSPSDPLRAE